MSRNKGARKTWTAGTLVYTSGGIAALFLWLAFGDFAWSMRDRSVGPMAQWYISSLNVSNLLYGLLLSSLPGLIGVIVGPIISVKSDRHRGKWGRRIPFLFVTTLLAAGGIIGLGLAPVLAKWLHGTFPFLSETSAALIYFGLFWSAFEVATVTTKSVFGGLINDVIPQPLLGRFYGMFRAVSLADGVIFNYWIFGKASTHFTLILLLVGILYGTAFLWVCLKVKEGEYPPPPHPEEPPSGNGGGFSAFIAEAKRYFRECFSNSYYVWLFVMMKLASLCFEPVNSYAIPYARSVGVSEIIYGKCLSGTFVVSFVLSYFLGWLADVFHPLQLALTIIGGYFLLSVFGFAYGGTAGGFLVFWLGHTLISGCYWTCTASLEQRLFPKSRFAQFGSAASMLTIFTSITLTPGIGIILDATAGDYRYTFLVSAILAILALICGLEVYRRFIKLGGPKGYIAPE